MRSFRLNFEVNAFIYNAKLSIELAEAFRNDLKVSRQLSLEDYKNRSLNIRFKESISRLLSPIL